jgi:hypothetical protein
MVLLTPSHPVSKRLSRIAVVFILILSLHNHQSKAFSVSKVFL